MIVYIAYGFAGLRYLSTGGLRELDFVIVA